MKGKVSRNVLIYLQVNYAHFYNLNKAGNFI